MTTSTTDFLSGLKVWRVWLRLAIREIELSIRRTILGPLWLVIHRIFFALAFSFLGALIWGGPFGLRIDVLTGYIVFATMIGYLQSANTALISSVNLTDSALPISVRFFKSWAKEVLLSVISACILIIAAISTGSISFQTVFLILLMFALASFWGFGLILAISPIAFRFRDVSQIISFMSIVLMFLSPIFWRLEDLQNRDLAEKIITFNPVADFIFVFRDIVNEGVLNFEYLDNIILHTLLIMFVGFLIFTVTRRRIPYWS
jgi:ABC-type polysaccharide/polyol phosphate export permease